MIRQVHNYYSHKLLLGIVASLMVLFGTSCAGSKKSKGKGAASTGAINQDENVIGQGTGGAETSSVQAFESSVYPLLQTYCKSCHAKDAPAPVAPFLASSDPVEAHDSIVNGSKVDLIDPPLSRIYLRLKADLHNCWANCDEDGAAILAGIEEWALVVASDEITTPENQTSPLKFADGVLGPGENPNPGTIVMEAEGGTLTGMMQMADVANASGAKVLTTPMLGRQQNAANSTDIAVFNVDIEIPGDYQVWVKTGQVNNQSDNTHIRLDQGAFITWRLPVAQAGEFVWAPINAGNRNTPAPLTTLAAGPHTIEIRRDESQSMFDMIAITNDPAFMGADTPTIIEDVIVLTYDVGELCGAPGTKFTIEALEHNEEAYKFKNPKIVSDKSIKIKNIVPVVNGKVNTTYATFKLVDKVVAPGSTDSLSEGALIVLKVDGPEQDTFGFQFEECVPQ